MSTGMSAKSGVERYRSPVSGSMQRMLAPAGALSATFRAPAKVAPAVMPTKIPSLVAELLAAGQRLRPGDGQHLIDQVRVDGVAR